jgi:alpha-tubulin suppressor-like RCC1 family protein
VVGAGLLLLPASPAEAAPPLLDVREVAAGYQHTCALMDDGTARCWGRNEFGQLGDATLDERTSPTPVRAVAGPGILRRITQIDAGWGTTCALLESTQVRCWGNNAEHQLADGTTVHARRPVVVRRANGDPLTGVTQITVGFAQECALLENATVVCWGDNIVGQLGRGNTVDAPHPVPVKNEAGTAVLQGVAQVEAGNIHTCATMLDGGARCWGWGAGGQTGDGNFTVHDLLPVVVVGANGPLHDVVAVSASATGYTSDHSCALISEGRVRCWGVNQYGALGIGNFTNSGIARPVKNVDGPGELRGAQAVEAGGGQTCAILEDAKMACWGRNDFGQLADGTTTNRRRPDFARNSGLHQSTISTHDLGLGHQHSCKVEANGRVRCAGRNDDGQLGTGNHAEQHYLVVVPA